MRQGPQAHAMPRCCGMDKRRRKQPAGWSSSPRARRKREPGNLVPTHPTSTPIFYSPTRLANRNAILGLLQTPRRVKAERRCGRAARGQGGRVPEKLGLRGLPSGVCPDKFLTNSSLSACCHHARSLPTVHTYGCVDSLLLNFAFALHNIVLASKMMSTCGRRVIAAVPPLRFRSSCLRNLGLQVDASAAAVAARTRVRHQWRQPIHASGGFRFSSTSGKASSAPKECWWLTLCGVALWAALKAVAEATSVRKGLAV